MTADHDQQDDTHDVDLLVVGGGMAGLTAAAAAATSGARVVLVEKGDQVGGSAVHAGFAWTAPSVEVLREQNPGGDPDLGAALVTGFPGGVEWMRSLGVECRPPVTDGAVTGADVRLPDGSVRRVAARWTLLATGGYQADPALRADLIQRASTATWSRPASRSATPPCSSTSRSTTASTRCCSTWPASVSWTRRSATT
jgi:hypothetical protein